MIDVLDYPFNHKLILTKKKAIKQALLKSNNVFLAIKIAILGGSSTNELKDQLELFLLKLNIKAEFYQCEFAQYYETIMFDNTELLKFKPDVIYLHVSVENLSSLYQSNRSYEEKAKEEFKRLKNMWERINSQFDCQVIQDNFEMAQVRPLGSFDTQSLEGVSSTLASLNLLISDFSSENSFLHISDRYYLSSNIGLKQWKNYSLWLTAKYSLSHLAITTLSYSLGNVIGSLFGKTKKCLVLDLDNILWSGVIGDDGQDGILLGNDTAIGEAFLDFQTYLKNLKNRGVILAVCSKNEADNAKSGFQHPDSVLKLSDFVAFKANWEPKSANIFNIANEINVGIDSMVFIDDNPVERDIVRKEFGGRVSVPEIGDDVTQYRDILDAGNFFCVTSITNEDEKRLQMYKENEKRNIYSSSFGDYNEYLKSLEMVAEISKFKKIYKSRISQLINKTNQFNLTTRRVTEQEVEDSICDKNKISLYARLKDKFGDNGLVSVIQGTLVENSVEIDLWVMSCRVFKRTLENLLLHEFLKRAREKGITRARGKFIPTDKNKIVANIYEEMGFTIVESKENLKEFYLMIESNKSIAGINKQNNIELKKI